MKKYTVTEIAKMLDVNKETVRRWVRSGQLVADMHSKKAGIVVSEHNLYEFMAVNPKYESVSPRPVKDDTYSMKLKDLLSDMIAERDMLNYRIYKLQTLLEEL